MIPPKKKHFALSATLLAIIATPLLANPQLDIRKVNGELIDLGAVAYHNGHKLTEDSKTVLYVADKKKDSHLEFFSRPFPPLPQAEQDRLATDEERPDDYVRFPKEMNEKILSFALSPDESTLYYLFDKNQEETAYVAAVPLRKPDQVPANEDGERIAPPPTYIGFYPYDGEWEKSETSMFSNTDLLEGPYITDFFVLPNSKDVVLFATEDRQREPFRFFKANVDDPLNVQPLGRKPVLNGNISPRYYLSEDTSEVIFYGDYETDGLFELFALETSTGAVRKINGEMVEGGQVIIDSFRVSNDEKWIVYAATKFRDIQNEIFLVPFDGGEEVHISPIFDGDGDATTANLQFSPDSKKVVYVADIGQAGTYQIFSWDIEAGGVTPLTKLPKETEFLTEFEKPYVSPAGVQVSNDSNKLLYRVVYPIYPEILEAEAKDIEEFESNATPEERARGRKPSPYYREDQLFRADFYVVNLDGTENERVNKPFLTNGSVFGAAFTPDSESVTYMAIEDEAVMKSLYVRDLSEDYSVPVSYVEQDVISFTYSPDGNTLFYLARDVVEREEDKKKKNEPVVEEPIVLTHVSKEAAHTQQMEDEKALAEKLEKRRLEIASQSEPSANSGRDQEEDFEAKFEDEANLLTYPINLYAYTLGSNKPPIRINPELPEHANVYNLTFSPDEKWLLYTADQEQMRKVELYTVSLDNITAAIDQQ